MSVIQRIRNLGSLKLFKTFSVYVLSTLFNQAASYLLIPVFTYYFTPGEYGILSLVNTTVSLLTVFIMVGADGAIRRAFYKYKESAYSGFFSSAFFTSIVAFVFISVLTALFVFIYPGDTGVPDKWILLSPVIGFTSILPTILLGQYRVNQQAGAFAVFSNIMTVANLSLAILFVVGIGLNYEGRLYSTLLVNSIFFIISFFILKRMQLLGSGNIKRQYSNESLKYGIPIIPHQLGAFVIAFSDRYFIANIVENGISEVGIYNIGYLVGGIIGVIEGAFGLAFVPFLFESLTRGTEVDKKKVVKLSYFFILFLAACVLLLSAFSGLLFEFFIDEKFHGAQRFVFWVATGYFFAGCYKIFSGYIFYHSKTIYLTYLAVINTALNLTLNYFLITAYGTIGAAYASCISYLVMFILTAFVSNLLVKMPWLGVFRRY